MRQQPFASPKESLEFYTAMRIVNQPKPESPEEALAHISEKPWSEYTKADYSVEQWHAACLIHVHEGGPTSKSQCKLPVKTPNGALNRNGVHAAAAALAGARGGLKGVSEDQKKTAANALKRYYAQLDEDPPDSLSHHGVKGMRWGVRKEEETGGRTSSPPERTSDGKVKPQTVPQKPGLSEKKQQKVDKFMKRSDVMGTSISELKVRNEKLAGSTSVASRFQRQANKTDIRNLEKEQTKALRNAEAVKKGKLTSTQKKVIIGGVAVGALVAYSMYVRGQQSGAINSYQLLAQARLRGSKVPFDVNKSLSGKMSAKDLLEKVVKPVNPGYSTPGGHMNCRRSTYAYELRRRGFDVHATTSAIGWGQSESGVINALTPGSDNFYRQLSLSQTVAAEGRSTVARGDVRKNPVTKLILDNLNLEGPKGTGSRRVFETLAKQPNGSRGEVMFKFDQFGHSMAYEIVDGKPHVFDSQKGTFHDAVAKTVEDKWGTFHGAEITRLDNADLDLSFLTRWATNN